MKIQTDVGLPLGYTDLSINLGTTDMQTTVVEDHEEVTATGLSTTVASA